MIFGLGGAGGGVFGVFCPLLGEDVVEGLFVGGGVEFGFGGEGAVGLVFDYIFNRLSGLRGGFGEVGAGDLEGVEEEAGAFGVEFVGGYAADDFAQVELDGGAGVGLEGDEGRAVGLAGLGFGFRDAAAGFVVVVAEVFLAERWAGAAVAGGLDVTALVAGFGHGCVPLLFG